MGQYQWSLTPLILKGNTNYLGGNQKRIAISQPIESQFKFNQDNQTLMIEVWGTSGYDRTYRGMWRDNGQPMHWHDPLEALAGWTHGLSDIWAWPDATAKQLRVLTAKEKDVKEWVLQLDDDQLVVF